MKPNHQFIKLLPFLMVLMTYSINAQTQLDIEGSDTNLDTVAKITVNYIGEFDVVGLKVFSHPFPGPFGIGGIFHGGNIGITGKTTDGSGIGVEGISTSGFGVKGESSSGFGLFGTSQLSDGVFGESFSETESGVRGHSNISIGTMGSSNTGIGIKGSSNQGIGVFGDGGTGIGVSGASSVNYGGYFDSEFVEDIVVGTSTGIISSDPDSTSSNLIIRSNNVVAIELDANGGDAATFDVRNDVGTKVFQVDEAGTVYMNGAILHPSDRNRKENITPVDSKIILERLSKIPITTWNYKEDISTHIGPMAQDFYASFGLGVNDISIATVDADGIVMAAIQALYEEIKWAKNKIENLEESNRRLIERLSPVEANQK